MDHMMRRPHQPRANPYTRYYNCRCCLHSRYPDRTYIRRVHVLYDTKRKVTPLESSHVVRNMHNTSPCRLRTRSSRTLFRPQARGDRTRMPSVLGESRTLCRLSTSWVRSDSQANSNSSTSIPYTSCQPDLVDNSWRWLKQKIIVPSPMP